MGQLIDLTGKTFGKWHVIQRAGATGKHGDRPLWLCRCSCGRTEKKVAGADLRQGKSKKCTLCQAELLRVIGKSMCKVFICDDLDPESIAMLQALYSRSPKSVKDHLKEIPKGKAQDFMKKYYVGYGHESIGDCGTTTLFFEGLSLLAAKAIQDNPLYSGQETSTRYVDFSEQKIIDPIGVYDSEKILKEWVNFYKSLVPEVRSCLNKAFPMQKKANEKVWNNAINARTFDIARGFLPAGITTQLSWSSNLRQASNHLNRLRNHPLQEVRGLANYARGQLKKKYPDSFSHPIKEEVESYYKGISDRVNYLDNFSNSLNGEDFQASSTIDKNLLEKRESAVLYSRVKGAELPRYLEKYGQYTCRFFIDYGCFRDLQRHRNGICQIPVIIDKYGFNSWYLDQLQPDTRKKAIAFINFQLAEIAKLKANFQLSLTDAQYFYPLGMNVFCEIVYSLPEIVYVSELRSGITVHPVLRTIAQKIGKVLEKNHLSLSLFVDYRDSAFNIKRGYQTITKKD